MTLSENSRSLTDLDVDALAWEFLRSRYARDTWPAWPLDQRLNGFLHESSLARLADNGDLFNILLERVMSYVSIASRSSRPGEQAGDRN